jgi:predicted CxxxxCH...CXXCH cytochrome family protein
VGEFTCTTCHGDPDRQDPNAPAPPFGTLGETDTSTLAVGAHQSHLNDGPMRRAIDCSECHTVPTDLSHVDGVVEMVFGPLATANGAQPSWDHGAATCSGSYCHGATLQGGSNTQPVWTQVDGTQAACGTCHGEAPNTGGHFIHVNQERISCGMCHPGYTPSSVNPDIHIDGNVDTGVRITSYDRGTLLCTSTCHGPMYWRPE